MRRASAIASQQSGLTEHQAPGAGRARRRAKHELELAAREFSFKEVRYLIAEASPFGFSWRCDLLGDLLAILLHVIDASRAPGGY
jgi:hypothetical protein